MNADVLKDCNNTPQPHQTLLCHHPKLCIAPPFGAVMWITYQDNGNGMPLCYLNQKTNLVL